jgi:hypothetical protein
VILLANELLGIRMFQTSYVVINPFDGGHESCLEPVVFFTVFRG